MQRRSTTTTPVDLGSSSGSILPSQALLREAESMTVSEIIPLAVLDVVVLVGVHQSNMQQCDFTAQQRAERDTLPSPSFE